tara:strand:- start:295 stop:456 length:162 start_codon:yes stop_codon:yes gene_type:complete
MFLIKGEKMTKVDNLEQLKEEGILDLISELGKLTDEELEMLVQANKTGIVGYA